MSLPNLTPDQQAALDKLTAWVDEGRKLFDLASSLGLGAIPGVDVAKEVIDGVDDFADLADKWTRGQMTALQAAVAEVETAGKQAIDLKFGPDGT